jgi:hypothetical protein
VSLEHLRSDLPAPVIAVVEQACHPDPEARYATAADLDAALASALQWLMSTRDVLTPAQRQWRRWRRAVFAMAAMVALALLGLWGGWNTAPVRASRRLVGLAVPPRSPLYLNISGGLAILRGSRLELVAHNPATAQSFAVSSDLGVRTMPSMPPWTDGAAYRLDGTPIAAPPLDADRLCCFMEGTTDGQFNYAVRTDSTLLDPIGSRPLAPIALYRFDRNWTDPRIAFFLAQEGWYGGVAYAITSRSFWLTRGTTTGDFIEERSVDGRLLTSMQIGRAPSTIQGIAIDPADSTLWVVRRLSPGFRLENFATSGRYLGSFTAEMPFEFDVGGIEFNVSGIEFAWIAP